MTKDSSRDATAASTRAKVIDPTSRRRARENDPTGSNGMSTGSVAPMLLVDELRRTVSTSVESITHQAGDMVTAVADALRTAANELRADNETLASIVESGDATLRGWASGLRDTAPQELARNLQRVVRRRPVLFVAGTLVAGVALAQLMKHAGEQQRRRRAIAPRSAGY